MAVLLISSVLMPSVAPVSGSLSQYGAPYAAKFMPSMGGSGSIKQEMNMPQATLSPEVLNAALLETQAFNPPWNQKMKYQLRIDGRGIGPFRSTGANLMRATVPRLMTREQAAEIVGVDAHETDEKIIKSAYYKAAFKAHPDAGGSNEKMKKLNDAKDLLLLSASHGFSTQDSTGSQQESASQQESTTPKSESQLYDAIHSNNEDAVKAAIKNNANIHERYSKREASGKIFWNHKTGKFDYKMNYGQQAGLSALGLALKKFASLNDENPEINAVSFLLDYLVNPGLDDNRYFYLKDVLKMLITKNATINEEQFFNYFKI